MGNVSIVFFDIDGTLVSFKTHRIPKSTLDAVAALRSRGIKVYIATGRPVPFIGSVRKPGCTPSYNPIKIIFLCHETMASITNRIS